MSYQDTVTKKGDYRVVLRLDEYPEEPYNEGAAPIFRMDGRYNVEQVLGKDFEHAGNVEEALYKWDTPNHGGWLLVEKYLRAFHGVKHIETYYSGSYWYVAIDPQAWREDVGAPADVNAPKAALEEYKAWINGEVYTVVTQRLTNWTSDQGDERDEWEDIDAIGGYYGYDYAVEAAKEAFDNEVNA
jgi:hypothetical protein